MCYFTCMYCPKLVIHSNQIKLPMASSVDYIISRMSLPFSKVLSLCTGTQNVKNIHMKFFPRVHFTSLALEKTINLQTSEVNSTSLRKHNHDWIYQTSMLMFFQFLKSLGYMRNLCCQNETSINKVWPITLIFRMNISGLFLCYLSCVIDEQDRYWKLSNGNQILALLIETQWDTRH